MSVPVSPEANYLRRQLIRELRQLEREHRPIAREAVAMQLYRLNRALLDPNDAQPQYPLDLGVAA